MAIRAMQFVVFVLVVCTGSTLASTFLHKTNKSAELRHASLPVPETLFMAGAGNGAGGQLNKAIELKKVEGKNQFEAIATLKSGGMKFVPSKDSWKGSFGIEKATMNRQKKFCKYCGLQGVLKMSEESGAVDVPGPKRKGTYKVVVDFDKGTVKYSCADNCWPHNKKSDDLFVVGTAVCDGPDANWKQKKGPKMDHVPGTDLYSKVVKFCPSKKGGGSFNFYRYQGNKKDGLGLWKGSWTAEESGNLVSGGTGFLKQWGGKKIDGPSVEAEMKIEVDMAAGTFTVTCEDNCNGPQKKDYERFEPENPVNVANEAFVHLFSWRWTDVATECEQFLGPKGIKAVQIAPPQESKVPPRGKGDSWNYNYRPVSYKFDSKMGNEEEFKDMIERCNMSGVDIYVDAVINHMAGGRTSKGSGGTSWGRRDFPETGYTPQDFHHFPDDDLDNCRLEHGVCNETIDAECSLKCDFNGMPDLDTSSEKVQHTLAAYLNKCIDYGVSGFRIDAADHIGAADLSKIMANVKPKYRFLETHYYEDKLAIGAVAQFKYKNQLMKILMNQDLKGLRTLGEASGLSPSIDSVVFIINHDQLMKEDSNGAGIIYKQPLMYTLANVVMLALPYGYPSVISSYYFPDGAPIQYPMPVLSVHGSGGELRCGDGTNWVCEHRWPAIANMFRWRKHASDSISLFNSISPKAAYFCRGPAACIIINAGDTELTIKPKLSLAAGEYCDIMISDDPITCPKTTVLADGTTAADVIVPALTAVAFHDGAANLAMTE